MIAELMGIVLAVCVVAGGSASALHALAVILIIWEMFWVVVIGAAKAVS